LRRRSYFWDGKLVEKTGKIRGVLRRPPLLPPGYCWHIFRRQRWVSDPKMGFTIAERRIKTALIGNGAQGKIVGGYVYERMVVIDTRARWLADYAVWLGWPTWRISRKYRSLARKIEATKIRRVLGKLGVWPDLLRSKRAWPKASPDAANFGCRLWDWRTQRWFEMHAGRLDALLAARAAGWPLRSDGLSLEAIAAFAGVAYRDTRGVETSARRPETVHRPSTALRTMLTNSPENAPPNYFRFFARPMLRVD
jgi:hypothetical protein